MLVLRWIFGKKRKRVAQKRGLAPSPWNLGRVSRSVQLEAWVEFVGLERVCGVVRDGLKEHALASESAARAAAAAADEAVDGLGVAVRERPQLGERRGTTSL